MMLLERIQKERLMWIDELTVALIAGDIEKFQSILDKQPKELNINDISTAMSLITEAQKICQHKLDLLHTEFEKIKLAKKFSHEMALHY